VGITHQWFVVRGAHPARVGVRVAHRQPTRYGPWQV